MHLFAVENIMKIKWKIISLPVIAILGTTIIMALSLGINNNVQKKVVLPTFVDETINSEKDKIKALILLEVGQLEELISGTNNEEEIKNKIIAQTDNAAYTKDKSGYFFIYDMKGNRINSPGVEGEAKISGNYWDYKDSKGKFLFRELIDAANKGGGFVDYWFPKKGETEPSPKISYVMPIKNTDYFVGTGLYIDQALAHAKGIETSISEEVNSYRIYFYIIGGLYILVLGVIAYLIIKGIISGLNGVVSRLMTIVDKGDTTVQIDDSLLARKDEIKDLAHAGKSLLHDYRKIAELATNLAEKNWCQDITVKSDHDEMSKSLSEMISEMNLTLSQYKQRMFELNEGIRQVSIASQALSEGATSQAASIEEVSASLIEMGGRINQNAKNAEEAKQLSKSANTAAVNGQQQMQDLTSAINDITLRAEETKMVVKTIDDIAFQTNLLALNAAVEAARAGIHGKGFAVVAEEVRNLAARSAKAAGETAELIDNVVRDVRVGNDMTQSTSSALNSIVEQISKASDLVVDIASASNDQAQGIAQINQGLEQIDAVTQENTASAEETAAASAHMTILVETINADIEKFKLKQGKHLSASGHKMMKHKPAVSSSKPLSRAAMITPQEQIKLDDSDFGKF